MHGIWSDYLHSKNIFEIVTELSVTELSVMELRILNISLTGCLLASWKYAFLASPFCTVLRA